MPKTTAVKGVIENAYGKVLPTPIKYEGEFEELVKGDEIPAKENPDADELLDYVNNKRKANARQKAMAAALQAAGIVKPEVGEDMEFTFKQMVKILLATGKDEATARQMANANLGTSY